MCTNYGNSENPVAKQAKELNNRIEKVVSAGGIESGSSEAKELYDDLLEISKNELSEMIKSGHEKGLEIPDEIKDQIKASPLGSHLTLENKMTIREKQRARREAEKKDRDEFTAATGIEIDQDGSLD